MDLDMFGQTVQDYENLKARAIEVYNIRRLHLDKSYDEIADLCISMYDVDITGSWYYRGETDYVYVSFPSSYLLMSNDEVNEMFKKEKEEHERMVTSKKEEQIKLDKERREAHERQQLAELIKKYGMPLGENNETIGE